MKAKKGQEVSITQPLLKDLLQRSELETKNSLGKMTSVDNESQEQPDLYQDSGSGYNVNFVFPQD